MKKLPILLLIFSVCYVPNVFSQGFPDYDGGLKIKLNEEGNKYFRIISWAQMHATYNDEVPDTESNFGFNLRRARLLAYAQLNKDFLILTHFGLNNLNSNSLSPVGTGDGSQLFFHDVWAQYNLGKNHSIGGGLHYWNGISRLNNQSTLNILSLDNNRQSWATLGLSDQFARHLGVYGKGNFGKLQYRVSINESLTNGLDSRDPELGGNAIYGGKRLLGSKEAGFTYAGYFDYNILDQESNFLPYKVGTYLGSKKVFNVGAGFFYHPSGAVVLENTELEGQDVSIFAVDVFYDAPLGENGGAISGYATFQANDYGNNYLFSAYGTGSMVYALAGYVIPSKNTKNKFQPYLAFASNSYDAVDDNRTILDIGVNAFFSGHHSKLTLEYKKQSFGNNNQGTVTLQAMIYL